MRTASLPMYFLPEMAEANAAFWTELHARLVRKGIDTSDLSFDHSRRPVPDGIGPEILFSQICGYPLFKAFRKQGRMLASPCYDFPGCEGPHHRAFFMVRADDPGQRLEDFRGRVFGCNSLLSNSGMNLPRLSLAKIAGGKPFFASVVMTGGHMPSLDKLRDGSIDLCSIDNVTWGFLKKYRPAAAAAFRVLAETVDSPSLPFVTSSTTSDRDASLIADALFELFSDPATVGIRDALQLPAIAVPDVAAYERLARYEQEAVELDYPELL